ncbi:MAG: hypothetical protein V3W14_12570 [Candidatus Neomarinimicrobiota bacterium]
MGGYHLGRFAVMNRGMAELTDFYDSWIGMKIVETTFGIESYSGIIWQLDLIKNGVNYRRTLNPRYWHNRVKVKYTDADGSPQTIAWSENTDSSGIYGEMEYIITLGAATSTEAQGERDSALTKNAWPKSRTVGGVSVGEASPSLSGDGLFVTVAGLSSTLNWQYKEDTATANADSLIPTLVGLTDFVTAGRTETNTLSIHVSGDPIPQRIGDLIEEIIAKGDGTDPWKGGVYADQKFVYEPQPTTIDYELRNGALYNAAGIPPDPALINPGFYVRDTNAPKGGQPPGTSNIWDDPQVSYCDEVEFIWPDMLKLKFPGERQSVTFNTLPPPVPLGLGPTPLPTPMPPPGGGGPGGGGSLPRTGDRPPPDGGGGSLPRTGDDIGDPFGPVFK